MVPQMHTQFKYGGHNIEVVPVEGGFFGRWPTGETYTTPTIEIAAFLAERLIDLPDIYGMPAISRE
jgi:hypothetical protein